MMFYRQVGEKIVLCNNGAYLSFSSAELERLEQLLADIRSGEFKLARKDGRQRAQQSKESDQ